MSDRDWWVCDGPMTDAEKLFAEHPLKFEDPVMCIGLHIWPDSPNPPKGYKVLVYPTNPSHTLIWEVSVAMD